MSGSMRAAVLHARGDLRVEARAVPVPRADEVLLQVVSAGVCGSDVGELDHGPVLAAIGDPHPVTGHGGPLVLGHELAGRVVEVGPDVRDVRVGDLVASGSGVSCGRCPQCAAGRTNLCETYWTVGFHRDGGLAEMVAVPASVCRVLDESVVSEDAAGLVQPVAIAVHSMRQGRLGPGERVATVGAGGVGAFLVAALRTLSDVDEIVTVEPDAGRRAIAADLGASRTYAPGEGDERSFDVVYEVSGTAPGLRSALSMVRRGGRVVLVGLQRPGTHDADLLRHVAFNELQLIGPNAHVFATDFADAAQVVAGRRDWSIVAPEVHSLDRLVPIMRDMAEGRAAAIKALFDPRIGETRPASYEVRA